MTPLTQASPAELEARYTELTKLYQSFKEKNLNLDMSRGKPCPEQLDLSAELLTCLAADDYLASDGTDCRNYGGADGLPEVKQLFADILEVTPAEVIISGNSSLNLMHDLLSRFMLKGLPTSTAPWSKLPTVKFLCPSPGYDRHFSLCEYFGIEMITVPMTAEGPDMDRVEALVAADDTIKGIWCVPKYSNPSGITYADSVVKRLAALPAKAADFVILWDNAYVIHHLSEQHDQLLNILTACTAVGHPDRVFMFTSTSKVSLPGSGVSAIAGSTAMMNWLRKHIQVQTIGPDKINQLRHMRFFGDLAGVMRHMERHAALLKPKFDLALHIFATELGGKGIATWSHPQGGYFISFDTLPGCAKKTAALAAAAGVQLTTVGSTYPYGRDEADTNIRIAPSFPPLAELEQALQLFTLCVEIASIEHLLAKN